MKQMAVDGIQFISEESRIIAAAINSRVRKICMENCKI
jgi:hypothetical protein